MNRISIPLVSLALLLLFGCSTEMESRKSGFNGNLLDLDITGEWNAYGYTDQSGPVPLEIIRIEQDGDKVTAIKVLGDHAIRSGETTWYGTFNQNPFDIKLIGAKGNERVELEMQMEIIDENTMHSTCYGLTFSRRSEEYVP